MDSRNRRVTTAEILELLIAERSNIPLLELERLALQIHRALESTQRAWSRSQVRFYTHADLCGLHPLSPIEGSTIE